MSFDVLVAIVIINMLATIALWQTTTTLRRTVQRSPDELKTPFTDALWKSKPITAKHQPPKVIAERFSSLVTETDKRFFRDFEDFADVMNWWFSSRYVESPWRLEELPDTELSDFLSDTPSFGRRYSIYHNQAKVGMLEVSAHLEPNVRAKIQVDYARLLPIFSIRDLFGGIEKHVCDPAERSEGQAAINACLTDALWQTQKITSRPRLLDSVDYGDLDFQIIGSAEFYFSRRGSDAFAKRKKQRL
jgi:hypothetical protein